MYRSLCSPKQNRENAHYGALDSEVLARLVYTLEDVLNTTVSISPDDSFTDLGGTSLTAMQYTALLREQGIRSYAAHLGGKRAYDALPLTGGSAFLIGNEGNGLSAEITEAADEKIIIPMSGGAESLNAAMAARILLFEA